MHKREAKHVRDLMENKIVPSCTFLKTDFEQSVVTFQVEKKTPHISKGKTSYLALEEHTQNMLLVPLCGLLTSPKLNAAQLSESTFGHTFIL